MRRSLRRWLFQRRVPNIKPLCQRTSWDDFAGRMHRAITVDMALLLGEVSLAEVRRQHITRPLDAYNAETVAEPRFWAWHECETQAYVWDDVRRTWTMPTMRIAKR